jgi:hypothetical protein
MAQKMRFKKGDLVIIQEGDEVLLNEWYYNSCVCMAGFEFLKGTIGEIICLKYRDVENIWKIKIPITTVVNLVVDLPEKFIRKLPEYKHG